MKQLKFITALIAVLTVSNLSFSNNLNKSKNDDLTEMVIEKLNKDIQLTDSQIVEIKSIFNILIKEIESSDSIKDEGGRFTFKTKVIVKYEHSLDSILTPSQREKKKQKEDERKNKKD